MVTKLLGSGVSEGELGDDALPGESEDLTDLQNDLDGQLNAVTSEFAADDRDAKIMLKVYRIVPQTGKTQYLFTITPAELPIMDRLRDEYGGGDFTIRVYNNGRLIRKLVESIGAPPKPVFNPKDANETMMQGFNKLADLLAARPQPQPAVQGPGMMDMMTGFAALLTAMKPLFDRPAPVVHEAAPQRDPIELVLKGMEMAREFGGGGENTGSTMMDILRDVVKGVAPALGQLALNPPAMPQPATVQPGNMSLPQPVTFPSQPTTAAPTNAKQENPAMFQTAQQMMMKKYIGMLVGKAAQNGNPELYAEFILDNVPEPVIRHFMLKPEHKDEQVIQEFMFKPDLVATMAAIDPRVSAHAQWFKQLENALQNFLLPDEEDLTGGGDGGDNQGHAPFIGSPDSTTGDQ